MLAFALGLVLGAALAPTATGPSLLVSTDREVSFTRSELLARPDLRELSFQVPGVAGATSLSAVPLPDLLATLPAEAGEIEVGCADGFVAVLPRAEVQNADPRRPMAYLAVERERSPFPTVKGQPTGPFMIVWTSPGGHSVPRELWPYQVTRISASAPVEKRYPRLAPATAKALPGFRAFVQNCLPCHPLNGEGPARVGPDLNLPHSPVEYLGPSLLTAYVRDPQSLHAWSAARMPPFPPSALSDAQLGDLIAYLRDRATAR